MLVNEFWHISKVKSEIQQKNYAESGAQLQVVKAMYSLVSTGTERLVATGRVPTTMWKEMKVPFMEGDFDFPVKYGYSLVGKVIEGEQRFIGKTVHLMHPHQDYVIVPSTHLTLMPDNIPLKRSVLISNMETALNILWSSEISFGNRVLVCGFGIIGALTAMLARQIPSTKIIVHEINDERRNIAESLGFEIFRQKEGDLFDIAINTTASGEALQICINSTLPASKIVEASWYGTNIVSLHLGESFHTGQKQIISSQVSNIPANKQTHFDIRRRKQVILELLQNDEFDKIPFQEINFTKLPELFSKLREGTYNHLATIVKY